MLEPTLGPNSTFHIAQIHEKHGFYAIVRIIIEWLNYIACFPLQYEVISRLPVERKDLKRFDKMVNP